MEEILIPTQLIMEKSLFIELVDNKNVKRPAVFLLMLLRTLYGKFGVCDITNAQIAKIMHKSISTIQKWLKNLKDNGYIDTEIIYKEGTKEVDKRIIKIKV